MSLAYKEGIAHADERDDARRHRQREACSVAASRRSITLGLPRSTVVKSPGSHHAQEGAKHAADIVARIEEDLVLGRRVPGAKLDERALADEFGVSRTPVREALHRLSERGLIILRGRQGAQVASFPVSDILDAFFIVAELEGMAARLAARRIRPAERDLILAAQDRCVASNATGHEDSFVQANAAFHNAIIQASRNRILQSQLHTAGLIVAPYRYLATFRPGRMASSVPEHQAIIDAILAGDGEGAAALMIQHVNLLGDQLSDVLHLLRERLGSELV